MKRAKLSNKLIVFIVLITMAIFTMGASSWLIITENPASPSWGQQEVTASISVTGTAYEGETGLILKSNVPGKLVYNNTTLATVSSSQLNTSISITKAPTNLSGAITNNALSASVTFEPNATWLLSHKILNETALSLSANVRAVMWDGSSTGYSSVNKALTTATSGTIYVLESFDTYCTFKGTTKTDDTLLAYKQLTQLTITGNHTIPANLVLAIPYSGTNDSYGYVASETVADRIRNAFATPLTYLKYHLTLGQSATLTVNGKLNLGGMIGGGNGGHAPASLTAADYGQLTVKSSSLITNNNEINSYGLIIEDSENNGSEIINNKKITYPFTIVEHRGGSAFVDLGGGYMAALGNNLQYNVAPFNRFYMANITPKMTTSSAGTLVGFLDLYINSTDNPISLSLLGSGSSFFINLGTGSKFVNKYSVSKKIHDWDFYGDLSFNSLDMKLPTVVGDRDLSTKNALFPISWHFNVAFHTLSNSSTATIKSTQDIKIMSGSSFHIDKGVTMEVGKIVAYGADFLTDTAHNQASGTLAKYENGNTEFSHGRLVVDGNLVANSVGGYVASNNNGAKLVISSANTVETREVTGSTSVAWSITAKGDIVGAGSNQTLTTNTYYSNGSAWYTAGTKNITYNTNGGSSVAQQSFTVAQNAPHSLTADNLSTALSTKQYYSLEGWYYDSALTQKANIGDVHYTNVTLYAKWVENTYTLEYKYVLPDGTTIDSQIASTQFKLSTSSIALPSVTNNVPTDSEGNPYIFSGWFDSASGGNIIDAINVSQMLESAYNNNNTNGKVTIYAVWVKDFVYEVIFETNNNDYSISNTFITDNETASLTPQSLDAKNNDTTYSKYFVGWYIDSSLTVPYANWTQLRDSGDAGNYVRTIYAKWINKVTVSFANTNNLLSSLGTTFYLNESQATGYNVENYSTAIVANDEVKTVSQYFTGWAIENATITSNVLTVNEGATSVTVTAQWTNKYALTISSTGGAVPYNNLTVYLLESQIASTFAEYDTAIKAKNNTASANKYFEKWQANGVDISTITKDSFDANKALTITAVWKDKLKIIINVVVVTDDDSDGKQNATFTLYGNISATDTGMYTLGSYDKIDATTIEYYIIPAHYAKIVISSSNGDDVLGGLENGKWVQVNQAITATIKSDNKDYCIATGTLITLADGTQKAVENITESDMLLVFNHETGKFIASPILFIECDGWAEYNVINLEYSNGTVNRLIYEHAVFDLTLNKYVYVTEANYQEFIGHNFAVLNSANNAFESVTLVRAYVTTEYTGCYSLVTPYHLNYFIDGMLSIPGGITGLFNYFEYGEGLKYDEEKMQADIEKYGLYTYEDFKDYVSYEVFEYAFAAKYFKVSVGKGLMTFEDILYLIERYVDGHNLNGESPPAEA